MPMLLSAPNVEARTGAQNGPKCAGGLCQRGARGFRDAVGGYVLARSKASAPSAAPATAAPFAAGRISSQVYRLLG